MSEIHGNSLSSIDHFLPLSITRGKETLRLGISRICNKKPGQIENIKNLHDLVMANAKAIHDDLGEISIDKSPILPNQVIKTLVYPVYTADNVHFENCFINTVDGPVYIDEGVTIMEGAMLRGPLYIGKHTTIKMGATLYAGTSIGEHCTVGGEVKNSIIDDFTNKSHYGYIGDSYIGRWCNLGAGTTNSNLKNTGDLIKVWDMASSCFKPMHQKSGIWMGDHVQTAVNTVFNGGSVIGPYSNIFDAQQAVSGYIPPFSWGVNNRVKYRKEKLLDAIAHWMHFKSKEMTPEITENINTQYAQYN